MKRLAMSFLVASLALITCVLIGLLRPGTKSSPSGVAYQKEVFAKVREAKLRPAPLRRLEFLRIVSNNGKIVILVLAGTVTFGIVGLTVLAYNGIKIGLLLRNAIASGLTPSSYLRYVLPHGVPEYLGYLIAQAVAMQMALEMWHNFQGGRIPFRWSLIAASAIAIVCVIVAAWTEVYVTPYL